MWPHLCSRRTGHQQQRGHEPGGIDPALVGKVRNSASDHVGSHVRLQRTYFLRIKPACLVTPLQQPSDLPLLLLLCVGARLPLQVSALVVPVTGRNARCETPVGLHALDVEVEIAPWLFPARVDPGESGSRGPHCGLTRLQHGDSATPTSEIGGYCGADYTCSHNDHIQRHGDQCPFFDVPDEAHKGNCQFTTPRYTPSSARRTGPSGTFKNRNKPGIRAPCPKPCPAETCCQTPVARTVRTTCRSSRRTCLLGTQAFGRPAATGQT